MPISRFFFLFLMMIFNHQSLWSQEGGYFYYSFLSQDDQIELELIDAQSIREAISKFKELCLFKSELTKIKHHKNPGLNKNGSYLIVRDNPNHVFLERPNQISTYLISQENYPHELVTSDYQIACYAVESNQNLSKNEMAIIAKNSPPITLVKNKRLKIRIKPRIKKDSNKPLALLKKSYTLTPTDRRNQIPDNIVYYVLNLFVKFRSRALYTMNDPDKPFYKYHNRKIYNIYYFPYSEKSICEHVGPRKFSDYPNYIPQVYDPVECEIISYQKNYQ